MSDHVKRIGERSVYVTALSAPNVQAIRELDGIAGAEADTWRIDYDTEDQLARILQRLRDSDIAFAGGASGWPPAAVAELLREKGRLHGTIKEISWMGTGQEIVQQR